MATSPEPTQSSSFKVDSIKVDPKTGKGTIVVDMEKADAALLQEHINLGSHVSVNLVIQARGAVDMAAAAPKAPPMSHGAEDKRPTSISDYTSS